jgi:hypothetical protein
MARSDMYRKLAWTGGDPRQVAEIVNNLVEGKSNNTGEITLAASGATSTTINDERIGFNSVVLLMPITANAANSINDSAPYGAWQDSTTQSVANTTTAYPITYNTVDYENGIVLSSSSRLTATYAGLYNIQFSLQLSNLANSTEDVDVWFRVNGTDVAKSNSIFGLAPRKNSTDPYHVIAAINFYVQLAANDYVQLMWRASNTAVTIKAQGTQTSPTRPATPSAIVTMNYLANGSASSSLFGGVYVSSTSSGSAVITHPANTATNKTYRYLIVA